MMATKVRRLPLVVSGVQEGFALLIVSLTELETDAL